MPFDSGTAAPVRPAAETGSSFARTNLETSPDFAVSVAQALAPFDSVILGPRRRSEALCRARQQIVAASEALVKAERRRVVAALTPAQLRKQILALVDSHTQLLDLLDDLERQPVIAGEVKRLRCRGELPWPL